MEIAADVKSDARPGSARELLAIAMPLVLSSGSLTLMLVVDRIFLTWYSDKALAAAMPAGMLHWTLLSLFIGTASYLNSFVAQYEGAQQRQRVAVALWQGIFFSLSAGLLLTFLAPLAGPIFHWAGHGEEVSRMEASFFAILCFGSPAILLSCSLSSFYSGRGQTMVIMWVNLAVSLIHCFLDYALIFTFDLGIEGAGIATVIAEVSTCVIFVTMIARDPRAKDYGIWKAFGFDQELFGRLLRYGVPNGCQMLIDGVCYTLFIFLVGVIGESSSAEAGGGTQILAATNLAFNLNTLAFLPMLGFGTAIATLVGNRIGEGRPDIGVRTTWIAFAISGTYMFLFGLVYLFLPDVMLFPYTFGSSEPEKFEAIRPIAILLLKFVAIYSLFDAMAIVFGAAIRGAGDTRFSMIYTLLCGVFLMLVPSYVGYRYFGGGITLAWIACTVNICAVGIGMFTRFQQGAWKTMRVIESFPGVPTPSTEMSADEAALVLQPANIAPVILSSDAGAD